MSPRLASILVVLLCLTGSTAIGQVFQTHERCPVPSSWRFSRFPGSRFPVGSGIKCPIYKPHGIKVVAFDLFGTVFDASTTPKEEMRDYVKHVRADQWRPLTLPDSWKTMPAFPDSVEGINRLRSKFIVVSCSNAPIGFSAQMAKNAGVQFDAMIPLELNRVYKPNLQAYRTICEVLGVQPESVLMVTANETSGDLEFPKQIGMQTIEIRGASGPQTILELADMLEQRQ